MKLLLDQQLASRLVEELADLFPGSTHVAREGLERADDEVVWEFARDQGYVIVSKDEDFHQRAILRGHPPKVIWLRLGNCTTADVEEALRSHREALEAFGTDEQASLLVVG